MSAEEAPTSVEIWRVLSLITRGKSDSAQQLRDTIASRFDEVMDKISAIPEAMAAIRDFVHNSVPTDSPEAQAHLLTIILRAIKQKKRPPSPQKPIARTGKHHSKNTDSPSAEEQKDFWNDHLKKFATQIKILYHDYKNPWYKSENLSTLSQAAAHFLEEFLRFYSETYEWENADKLWTSGVAIATKERDKRKKKNKWEQDDSDEDDKETVIYHSDATMLMLIFTIVHSYIEYLDRNLSVLPDHARQSDFLRSQLKDNKWQMFSVIVHTLKKFLFEKEILKATREFEFSFEDNLTTLVQNWDSMGMQIEELK